MTLSEIMIVVTTLRRVQFPFDCIGYPSHDVTGAGSLKQFEKNHTRP